MKIVILGAISVKSKKLYYQHLYKDLLNQVESFDGSMGAEQLEALVSKIATLDKKQKSEFLYSKLKSNKNFVKLFNSMFQEQFKDTVSQKMSAFS